MPFRECAFCNNTNKKNPSVSYFQISDTIISHLSLGREYHNAFICSEHFDTTHFLGRTLPPGVLPTFLHRQSAQSQDRGYRALGCCRRPCTRHCCIATSVVGGLFLLLGLVVMVAGPGMLQTMVSKSMVLSPASDRLQSWLYPPVQAHLTGYGWHVTNPEAVMQGKKPVLEQVGPFVYKAVTIKDSVDKETGKENIQFNDDGETLTYRPRKFYFLDREQSVSDPKTTFITVPNIPLLSALSKIRELSWAERLVGIQLVTKTGLATPFINVSFDGLLWGYNDELPCSQMTRPEECGPAEGAIDIFAEDGEEEEEMIWSEDDWKRKKRSAGRYKREALNDGDEGNYEDLKHVDFDSMQKLKADFVDCKCEWGLFRDRNVTLRKPVRIHHGMADLSKKGLIKEYDDSKVMNWWQPGSKCDALGGADGASLPPGILKEQSMDMFISLMCRRINLEYEGDVGHDGLTSYRFIPPANAMGSHEDEDMAARNEDNECYCLKDQGFSCFKSGVLNLQPCKRSTSLPKGAPIALSYPHFYQADPSFREAVVGMKPNKTEHQFYVDIEPNLGIPLAIRPRFQLNVIIKRDKDVDMMSNFAEELILPFLWAQDGFSTPSPELSEALKFGVSAPSKLSMLGGSALLVLGGALLATALVWVFWARRGAEGEKSNGIPMS